LDEEELQITVTFDITNEGRTVHVTAHVEDPFDVTTVSIDVFEASAIWAVERWRVVNPLSESGRTTRLVYTVTD
jgi:predicted SnoaL-like aldol condensation-catalyzing enzyme